MFQLRTSTPPAWLEAVFSDFDAFLADHTLCERKASALGLSLVAKYPDRVKLIDPLIAFAREELEHFHIMYRVLASRGLPLPIDAKDDYVNGLRQLMRTRGENLLLDRLIVSGIVEARGCERLSLVAGALDPGELKQTYLELTRAESRHHALFFRLAGFYFDEAEIRTRSVELFDAEAELVGSLPFRAAVH
jgi:tRNA 2-(methylsulfanyl)-N6-isopentenyladenosine37 hydroxylase